MQKEWADGSQTRGMKREDGIIRLKLKENTCYGVGKMCPLPALVTRAQSVTFEEQIRPSSIRTLTTLSGYLTGGMWLQEAVLRLPAL